jgi:exonuclease SbcD
MSDTETIRLLHFADIHIGMENFGRIDPNTGVNQRVLDFVSRLKEIVDLALERDIDIVIFAGDAFKTRDPNPTYQREFARQIMRLSRANVPVVLLVGNHDMPIIEKRATSLDIYNTLDVPNVIVGRDERLHKIETKRGTIQVATVPYPQRSRLMQGDDMRGLSVDQLDAEIEKALEREIARLASETDPALPAVLTGHFTISGATFGSERNVMIGRDAVIKLSALNLAAWDYVAMGHIHKHQNVTPGAYPSVVYSGSLERIDFGEESESKGYVLVDLKRGETKWAFEPVAVRDFVSIYVDATNDGDTPTEAVIRAIERKHFKDAVVRVRIKLLQSQETQLRVRDIENELSDAYFIAGISKDIQRETRSRIGLQNPESLSPAELLEKYFLSKNLPQDRIESLMNEAKAIMRDD